MNSFGYQFVAVLLSLLPSLAIAQPDTKNEQEVLTPKRPVIKVQIENPDGHDLELHFLQDFRPQLMATFGDRNKTLLVQEGKYFLLDKTSSSMLPVPAIYLSKRDNENLPLKICVTQPHKIDEKTKMAFIPSGPALVGDELGVGPWDERRHGEDIAAFWIAQFETTNAQYVEFLNAAGRCQEDWLDLGSRKCGIKTVDGKTFSSDFPQHPVVMVSHAGAIAYCQWRSEKTGEKYRLPTEYEWEKAARGPYSSVYAYGNRYDEAGANQESGAVSPVGKFRRSPWGLYDMTGNVFEWMSNKYNPDKPSQVMNQALRGGSFVLDGMYLRNSFRMRQSPTVMTDEIGFRVVREVNNE